jgi:L-ascorbate 6-phosphate lactonase
VGDSTERPLEPQTVMLVGLQGSGKTTTAAKMAWWFETKGLRSAVVQTDTFRPGAFEQAEQMAGNAEVEFYGDPDAEDPVGYVIEYDGRTLFHAGDARPSAAFETIGEGFDIDVGVVAFGSTGMIPDKETGELHRRQWYNDENQIVECARALRLDTLVPTHWDMWRGLTADPTALHHHIASYDYPEDLEILQIGDRVDL